MKDFDNFEELIGYNFNNKSLLKQALTHSSAIGSKCNERMEFLGDSVLSVVVAKYLYDNLTTKPEGYLTKLRANLVCEGALFNYAQKLDLGERLIMGKGEENTGGRTRKSILSDAFEAVIAAIFLDGGLDNAQDFIVQFLPDKKSLQSGKLITGDYKTSLQEIVQQTPDYSIYYDEIGEKGNAHEKTFFANVVINGKIEGSGSGHSKKESQQQAARAALIKMGYSE
jgi:ribonuclease-3